METPNPAVEQPGPAKKARKWPARLISLLLVAMLAVGVMSFSLDGFTESLQVRPPLYQQPDFLARLPRFSYLLNWRLEQEARTNYTLTPAQLYYPGLYAGADTDSSLAGNPADSSLEDSGASDNSIIDSSVPGPDSTPADAGPDATGSEPDQYTFTILSGELADFLEEYLQSLFINYAESFSDNWEGLEYLVYSPAHDLAYGSAAAPVAALARGAAGAEDLAALESQYTFYAALHFGPNGELSPAAYGGVSRDHLQVLEEGDMGREFSDRLLALGYDEADDYRLGQLFRPASNLTVVFAIPAGAEPTIEARRYDIWSMERYGAFHYYLWFALALAAVLGLALAAARPLGLNRLGSCRQPLEVSALFLGLPLFVALEGILSEWLVQAYKGTLVQDLVPDTLDAELTALLNYGFYFLLLACLFWLVYSAAASLMQLRNLGPREYFTRHVLLVRFCRWLGRQFRRLWRWLADIDLTEKGNRAIIKILAVNFVILAVLCTVWVFGIALLLVYTVALFILLRRYYTDLKHKYAILLEATGKMAEGELDVPIEEDLGVFEPVKQELKKVQHGFAHAVEAETRSQNMKTELITNVSHDLKTPLTAIITYVDLLKKEDITEEERREYVATLDRKSQRLKRLIEDLFEMSRAASRDLSLNLQTVDLPALIRQVELEAEDELAAANIEFRYQFPEEKVELPLDSEKTSRIFENLILNVAKYGMPGSRAYVALRREDGAVEVEVKNVSRDELDFEGKDITDRFVRGDASRSTEGSGLGLAIAKSFVEAQGGTFSIQTDGDLFKARITFSC